MRARVAFSPWSSRACSTSASAAPSPPGLYTSPAWNSLPAPTIASPASRRFETSLSGSCRRNTSMPFSAAEATKRRTKSALTGREPTRNRPRNASPSGVVVRAFSARIRSHGLSTPRRTAVSKTPPPETSSSAKPTKSSTSAMRSSSPAGRLPASGSCERRRTVVSTSRGTCGAYRVFPGVSRPAGASGAADVAAFARVDLDPVARVDEEGHLDDRARLEGRRLRHVRHRVAPDAGLGVRDRELDRGRKLHTRGLAADEEQLDGARRLHVRQLRIERVVRQRELLVRPLVHEDDLISGVVEVLHVLDLGEDARELLTCTERLVDHGAGVDALHLGAHERAALARLHVLELDDAPHRALELDVHAVLELVRADDVGHGGGGVLYLGPP